jgi:hypothetical protein
MSLDIATEMRALDSKDRDFLDNLSDDDKKKFSTYLMIRWGSSVSGITDLQAYYLQATNLRLNKNFFAISKKDHDKLNWLAATTISPNMGNHRHDWIKMKKKEGDSNKVQKFLEKLYPTAKTRDLELLAEMNDVKAWKRLAEEMGMDKAQIKKELG